MAAGLSLALAVSGCGRDNDRGQTLNYAQMDEPRALDPAFVKDLYEGIVSGFLYDGLVVFGQGADVQPGLAESWSVGEDGRAYTFKMRRGAKFSDGRPVTSADVRYSLTRVLRPETLSQRKWVLDRIVGAKEVIAGTSETLAGLETPDAATVVIKLEQAYPPFLTMLAMPNAAIIPDGAAGAREPDPEFDRKPIGSGPWVLADWVHDQRLEFAPNPHYWGTGPKIKNLFYHVQPEDSVRYRQFEAGNMDIIQVGFQAHENWQNDPEKAAMTTAVQELRTDYIGVMCHKPPLTDLRVRQALAKAVDGDVIFEKIQKKRGIRAAGVIPPGVPGYREGRTAPVRDVAAARALLAEAGQANLTVSLWYREEPQNSEMAQAVKGALAEAGVKVVLTPRDQAALRQSIHEGAAELYLGSWTLDYPDPENAIYPPFHSRNIPRQGNGAHFKLAEMDELLDRARVEGDEKARIGLYQQAEDLVMAQAPWIPLFHRKVYYAVQPGVKGWKPALIYNADRFNEVRK